MEESARTLLVQLFRDLPDPRMVGKISHKLHDILVMAVCVVTCGLEHWTQIADCGKAHESWFRTFLDLPDGIPAHDTFGRRIQRWIHAYVHENHAVFAQLKVDDKTNEIAAIPCRPSKAIRVASTTTCKP